VSHKITFKSKAILDAVSKVAIFAANKSPIQALQCVRVTLGNGVLELSASDGSSVDISVYIETDSDGEFDLCLLAEKLLPKLQVFAKAADTIDISFGKIVTLKAGKHVSRINSISPDLFPDLDRSFIAKIANIEKVASGELVTAIRMTVAAADPKSPFPALEGIFMNGVDIVSADGARLAVYKSPGFIDDPTVVPAASLSKIAQVIADVENIYVIRYGDKLVVGWDTGVVTSTIISHSFPDYKSIVPNGFETKITVKRTELLEALNLATVDAVDSSNLVIISVSEENGMAISAESGTGGHSSTLDYTKFSGNPQKIGLSIKYLKDATTKLNSEEITFGINSPENIVVLTDSDSYVYGIMPMSIS